MHIYVYLSSFHQILVDIEYLQLVWHADRGRLLLRTPGPVQHWDLQVLSCWEQSLLNLSCFRTFEFRTSLGTSVLLTLTCHYFYLHAKRTLTIFSLFLVCSGGKWIKLAQSNFTTRIRVFPGFNCAICCSNRHNTSMWKRLWTNYFNFIRKGKSGLL